MAKTSTPRAVKQSTPAAADTHYPAILDACRVALGVQAARTQLKQGKASLSSMADRLKSAGVTNETVKAARESFSLTLHSVLGLAQPERSKGEASTDIVVRMLVKGMAEAVGIDALKLSGAVGSAARKELYAAPMKALQRLASKEAPKRTAPADVYEAAQSWGEKLRKEFASFKPKAINDPAFKRFAQVLFDSLTIGE